MSDLLRYYRPRIKVGGDSAYFRDVLQAQDDAVEAYKRDSLFRIERAEALRQHNLKEELKEAWGQVKASTQSSVLEDSFDGDRYGEVTKVKDDFITRFEDVIDGFDASTKYEIENMVDGGVLSLNQAIVKKETSDVIETTSDRLKVHQQDFAKAVLRGDSPQEISALKEKVQTSLDVLKASGVLGQWEYTQGLRAIEQDEATNSLRNLKLTTSEIEAESGLKAAHDYATSDLAKTVATEAKENGDLKEYQSWLQEVKRLNSAMESRNQDVSQTLVLTDSANRTAMAMSNVFNGSGGTVTQYLASVDDTDKYFNNAISAASMKNKARLRKQKAANLIKGRFMGNLGDFDFTKNFLRFRSDLPSQKAVIQALTKNKGYSEDGEINILGMQASTEYEKLEAYLTDQKGFNTGQGQRAFLEKMNQFINTEDYLSNGVGIKYASVDSQTRSDVYKAIQLKQGDKAAKPLFETLSQLSFVDSLVMMERGRALFGDQAVLNFNRDDYLKLKEGVNIMLNQGRTGSALNLINHLKGRGYNIYLSGKEPLTQTEVEDMLYAQADQESSTGQRLFSLGYKMLMGGAGTSVKTQQLVSSEFKNLQNMLGDYFSEHDRMRGVAMTPEAYVNMKAVQILGMLGDSGRLSALKTIGKKNFSDFIESNANLKRIIEDDGPAIKYGKNTVLRNEDMNSFGVQGELDEAQVSPFHHLFQSTLDSKGITMGLRGLRYKSPELYNATVALIANSRELMGFNNPQDLEDKLILRGNVLMFEDANKRLRPLTDRFTGEIISFSSEALKSINEKMSEDGYDPSKGIVSEWQDIGEAEGASDKLNEVRDFLRKGIFRVGNAVYSSIMRQPEKYAPQGGMGEDIHRVYTSNMTDSAKDNYFKSYAEVQKNTVGERVTNLDHNEETDRAINALLAAGGVALLFNPTTSPVRLASWAMKIFKGANKAGGVKKLSGAGAKILQNKGFIKGLFAGGVKNVKSLIGYKKSAIGAVSAYVGTRVLQEGFVGQRGRELETDFQPVFDMVGRMINDSQASGKKAHASSMGLKNGFKMDGYTADDISFLSNYDGDTATFYVPGVGDYAGKNVTVRLDGVDTEELRTNTARAWNAKKFIYDKLSDENNDIKFKVVKIGYHQRIVGRIEVNGEDLSQLLLNAGLADSYIWKAKR